MTKYRIKRRKYPEFVPFLSARYMVLFDDPDGCSDAVEVWLAVDEEHAARIAEGGAVKLEESRRGIIYKIGERSTFKTVCQMELKRGGYR
jgi:hypothetical protein